MHNLSHGCREIYSSQSVLAFLFFARMETTSLRGKIQLSQTTADLVMQYGKSHWLSKREGRVEAKGKGKMQTYWLEIGKGSSLSDGGTRHSIDGSVSSYGSSIQRLPKAESNKTLRQVNWTTEVLRKLLKEVVARRELNKRSDVAADATNLKYFTSPGKTVLEEVTEVIALPRFDAKVVAKQQSASSIRLGEEVETQLHSYVTNIAYMYRSNAFHSFDVSTKKRVSTAIISCCGANPIPVCCPS